MKKFFQAFASVMIVGTALFVIFEVFAVNQKSQVGQDKMERTVTRSVAAQVESALVEAQRSAADLALRLAQPAPPPSPQAAGETVPPGQNPVPGEKIGQDLDRIYRMFSDELAKAGKSKENGRSGLIYFGTSTGGLLLAGRTPDAKSKDGTASLLEFCDLVSPDFNSENFVLGEGDYHEFFVDSTDRGRAVSSYLNAKPDGREKKLHFLIHNGEPWINPQSPRKELQEDPAGRPVLLERLAKNMEKMRADGAARYNATRRPWYDPAFTRDTTISFGLFTYFNGLDSGVSALRRVKIRVGSGEVEGVLGVDLAKSHLRGVLIKALEELETGDSRKPVAAWIFAPKDKALSPVEKLPVVFAAGRQADRLDLDVAKLEALITESGSNELEKGRLFEKETILPNIEVPSKSAPAVTLALSLETLQDELGAQLPWRVGLAFAEAKPVVPENFAAGPVAWSLSRYPNITWICCLLMALAALFAVISFYSLANDLKVAVKVAQNQDFHHRRKVDELQQDLENKEQEILKITKDRERSTLKLERLMERSFRWLRAALGSFAHEISKKLGGLPVDQKDSILRFIDGEIQLAGTLYNSNPEMPRRKTLITADLHDKRVTTTGEVRVKTYDHAARRIVAELITNACKYNSTSSPITCRLEVRFRSRDGEDSPLDEGAGVTPSKPKRGLSVLWSWLRSKDKVASPSAKPHVLHTSTTPVLSGRVKLNEGWYLVAAVHNFSPTLPKYSANDREALFQAHETGLKDTSGTGVGLYTSRKIARTLGGDLILRDADGGTGIVFELWLPAEKLNPASEVETHYPWLIHALDDEPRVLEGLQKDLANLARVEAFTDVTLFLDKFDRDTVGMAIIDYHLGETSSGLSNGIEVARALRTAGFCGIIVLYTGEQGVDHKHSEDLSTLQTFYVPKGGDHTAGMISQVITEWIATSAYPLRRADVEAIRSAAVEAGFPQPWTFRQIEPLVPSRVKDPVFRAHLLSFCAEKRSLTSLLKLPN